MRERRTTFQRVKNLKQRPLQPRFRVLPSVCRSIHRTLAVWEHFKELRNNFERWAAHLSAYLESDCSRVLEVDGGGGWVLQICSPNGGLSRPAHHSLKTIEATKRKSDPLWRNPRSEKLNWPCSWRQYGSHTVRQTDSAGKPGRTDRRVLTASYRLLWNGRTEQPVCCPAAAQSVVEGAASASNRNVVVLGAKGADQIFKRDYQKKGKVVTLLVSILF